jgi:hypothetical protein
VFLQLVDILVRESAEKLGGMRAAAAASDFERLGFLSHALKGTVGPVGADALVQMLLAVENACNRKQFNFAGQNLLMIERESENVQKEVQHFAAQL